MTAEASTVSPKVAAGLGAVAAGAVAVAAVSQLATPTTTSTSSAASAAGSSISTAAFLNRATFGATDTSIAAYQLAGQKAWFAAQLDAAPTPAGASGFWSSTPSFHLQWIMRRQSDFAATYQAALAAATSTAAASNIHQQSVQSSQFQESFWARAVLGDDQLRNRMALALSEIFVVSFESSTITPRIAASWYDMLSANAFGGYFDLLKAVTLHPAMGLYLNVTGSQQADNDPTRHADQNYAREVLQLMSVGLVSLNADGSTQLNTSGASSAPFQYADMAALANVFTGWGWDAAKPTVTTFSHQPANGTDLTSPDVQNLISYPLYHSQLAKTFLGTTIAAYTGAAPTTAAGAAALTAYQTQSLDTALKTIAAQPNVAPFIGRRLIQRFVTSNPSAAYVGRVAAAFTGDTSKPSTYGNLMATLAAVLTDPDAQSATVAAGNTFGKLREPVVRMTHWLRACEATSTATTTAPLGNFVQFADFGSPDQLDQAPLEAISVFNFWTPDYVPPGTNIAKAGLVAPEFQAVDVLTVASYANLMIEVAQNMGWPGGNVTVPYTKEVAALTPPGTSTTDNNQGLIDRINLLFFGGAMSTVLSARLLRVLNATVSTAKAPTAAQKSAVQIDKVKNAFIIAMTSPEYIVQR
jgi:uncharacterized protein (DUF1800 family)